MPLSQSFNLKLQTVKGLLIIWRVIIAFHAQFVKPACRAETRQCAPPRNHLSGPPKNFFLDGDAKERAAKGRCQAWGFRGHALPENFAEFHLILEAFCAF